MNVESEASRNLVKAEAGEVQPQPSEVALKVQDQAQDDNEKSYSKLMQLPGFTP